MDVLDDISEGRYNPETDSSEEGDLPDGMSDVSNEEAQNLMDQCISGDVFSEEEEESRKQECGDVSDQSFED